MNFFYIKKNRLFPISETVTSESDNWVVSELVVEHKTVYSWTNDIEEAKSFTTCQKAQSFLSKKYKQSFFKKAEIE